MIVIIEHDKKKLVSSLDVYKQVGYNPTHYARWIQSNLRQMGNKGVDFFDITDKKHQKQFFPKTWQHKCKISPELYFLTLETAITVCFMAKTEKAKLLKQFLQSKKVK